MGVFSKLEYHKTAVPALRFPRNFMAVFIVGNSIFLGSRRLLLFQIIGTNNKVVGVSRTELDATRWKV